VGGSKCERKVGGWKRTVQKKRDLSGSGKKRPGIAGDQKNQILAAWKNEICVTTSPVTKRKPPNPEKKGDQDIKVRDEE